MGDLASMSSGLKWKEDYENLLTITPRTYVEKDMARLMKTIPIESEPGQQFVYQSGNTQLLAMALQQATGQSISVLLRDYFWNPMGVEQPSSWIIDSETHGLKRPIAVGTPMHVILHVLVSCLKSWRLER